MIDLPKADNACAACGAFVAECLVPVGEGSAAMCWPCAHHVVDHDVALRHAMTAECECAPEQVYPASVIERQRAMGLRPFPNASAWDVLGERLAPHLPFVREQDTVPRDSEHAKHEHGTIKRYWNGCRCDDCRTASASYQRSRRAVS